MRLLFFLLKSWLSGNIGSLKVLWPPHPATDLKAFVSVFVSSLRCSQVWFTFICPVCCFLSLWLVFHQCHFKYYFRPVLSLLSWNSLEYVGSFHRVPYAAYILFSVVVCLFVSFWIFSNDLLYSFQILLCYDAQSPI